MRAATVLSVSAVAYSAVAVALAEQPLVPEGNYGGGTVVAPPRSLYAAGNMLIGLRALRGELQINVAMTLTCTRDAQFFVRVTPATDGSFRVKGTQRSGRVRTRYVLAGTIFGPAAGGTASASTSITRAGHTTSCPVSKVRWQARRATGEIGIPPPAPRERMFGTTSQRLHGPRRAITLRLSSDGAWLARALYDVTVRCGERTITDTYDAPKRNLAIAADGSVRDVEHFTFKNRRTIYRSTERFAATIGATGARGTFSTVARIADRRSGATLVRCRSGAVRWTAST